MRENKKEVLREWRTRLDAVAALEAIEDAPQLASVAKFRELMPDGIPFPSQNEAIKWLRSLVAAQQRMTEMPEESPLVKTTLDILDNERVLDDFFSWPQPRDATGSRPHIPYGVDLFEGDPDFEPQKEDIDENGDLIGNIGPLELVIAQPYGPLGELLCLGHILSACFGWTPESARAWLICSTCMPCVPAMTIESIRSSQRWKKLANGFGGHYWQSRRVRIEIDLEIPPRHAADFLRAELKRLRGDCVDKRPVDPHIASAVVLAARMNDGNHTWADVLGEWTAKRQDDWPKFSEGEEGVREFTTRTRRAYKRLRGNPLKWRSKTKITKRKKPRRKR